MAFQLEPVDESFFRDAPQRYVFAMALPVPPERVWETAMAGEHPLRFVRGLSVHWTSPAPRGVGSTRNANAGFGAFRLQERYIVWEDGHRNSFIGTAVNAPLFRRFGEDYVVEPTADGCRFTWTFASDLRGPKAVIAANDVVQRAMFGRMAADVRRHFRR